MYNDKYIFSQIVDLLPRRAFDTCVERYNGNKNVYNLSCRDQFLSLMFGQLTNLNSLRGIVLCLNAHPNQLYHLGFKTKKFTLSTLARANQNREWRIWRDFTDHLIGIARKLYLHDNDFSIDLKNTVYVLDSTVAIAKKKQLKVKQNLYEILQILQVSQFEKTALHSLISNKKSHFEENERKISLNLAEF